MIMIPSDVLAMFSSLHSYVLQIMFRTSKVLFSSFSASLSSSTVASPAAVKRDLKQLKDVAVIGFPFWKGQAKTGTELAPQELRRAGLMEQLEKCDVAASDWGDVNCRYFFHENTPADPSEEDFIVKRPAAVSSAVRLLSQKVSHAVSKGKLPLVLGGDHSLGMGSVHGHSQIQPELCVIWIDAHADINTESTTGSGNMHGMPASFLIREVSEKYRSTRLKTFGWLHPCISSAHFAYIGLRDLDEPEKRILQGTTPAITYFTMADVDKYGMQEVISRVLDSINPKLNRPIHVSFDVDALDPHLTPSTGTPVPAGMTLREAQIIGREVAKTGLLSALDLVEVNPSLGSAMDVKNTINCAFQIIQSFLTRST